MSPPFDVLSPKVIEAGRLAVSNISGAFQAAKDDCVQLSQKFISRPRLLRCVVVLMAVYVLAGSAAHAQNLDQGKSATRLFADSCATCHRGAPGLAGGRSRAVLFQFLQEHYATSSNTAAELASYLASVDTRRSGRSRVTAGKPPRSARPRPPKPAPSSPRVEVVGESSLAAAF
jgi:mono/diheme cytochrome c family protein